MSNPKRPRTSSPASFASNSINETLSDFSKICQNSLIFNSNKGSKLLTVENVQEIFDKFKSNFNEAKNDIRIGKESEEIYESVINLNKKKDQTMVQIAFFGSPGSGKSTAINFLITGKLKGVLPNSSQKGEGCTKFPIRCLFKDHCIK